MSKGPEVVFVNTLSGLEAAKRELAGKPKLYLDTEFDSSRRGMVLSIIQVTAGDRIFLIDGLGLNEPELMREVLGGSDVEWVLHAASQDLGLLLQVTGRTTPPLLFDTQVAWALLTAEASVGLAYLQYKLCGVRSMKTHQADDWLRRPLPPQQLQYAASDVQYLPQMEQKLSAMATQRARRELICAASVECLATEPELASPLTLESFRNAWQLEARNQAALLELIRWYNELSAVDQERAPQTKTLLSIASRLPRDARDLGHIKGVSAPFVARSGATLLKRLHQAARSADTGAFEPLDPLPYATFEGIELDAWITSMRAGLCVELSVAPEFALPSRTTKQVRSLIVQHGSRAAGAAAFTGWRETLLREPYLRWCERFGG